MTDGPSRPRGQVWEKESHNILKSERRLRTKGASRIPKVSVFEVTGTEIHV